MVLIDADVIVTRPLDELIDRASKGRVLVVEHEHDRFFPQWGELLGLRSSRRRHYVSSGFILAGGAPGGRVVELMHEAQPRIGIEETPYSAHSPDLNRFDLVPGHARGPSLLLRRPGRPERRTEQRYRRG